MLDEKLGVSLAARLLNKKKKMALEGVCKSKIDKVNKLDVIADDKKLINGYVNIIKELAIKYGVA
jgi:anti-repressor protein